MLRGIHAVSLDEKGRLAMPTRHRTQLAKKAKNQLIITIDTEEHCLLLYPLPEWELIEQKLIALPSFNPSARRIQRLLLGHAAELELDKSGRILIPPLLREYALLNKQAVLVGQGKKFEIWAQATWETERAAWLTSTDGEQQWPPEIESLSI